MKLLKKLAGMLLAMIMVLSMSTVAFAAQGTNDDSGSITINDAEKGHTYNAYQVLVLESYNTAVGAYSYKANSALGRLAGKARHSMFLLMRRVM